MIASFGGDKPQIDNTAFVHASAQVIGKVKIGPGSSVWPNAVIRGDVEEIVIGKNTNIQDNAVLHTDQGLPTHVGDGVTIGHSAVLHGCTVGNNSLIGIGAIVLNAAVVAENVVVGAGAVVAPRSVVPKGCLVLGVPAKTVRSLNADEIKYNYENAVFYIGLSRRHKKEASV